jgi:hypothetical protein
MQDFIELSLSDELTIEPLAVNLQPELNETVFAVGNALGEGVVVRDGLLTSQTPEDLHGEWKWLRFSAAASPGNSGGPLLDTAGRVIGVILRKSPNENLNYAVPIDLVLNASTAVAKVHFIGTFSTPVMDVVESGDELVEFPLPCSFATLSDAETERVQRFFVRGRDELLRKHAGSIFPKGAGSEMLLAVPPRLGYGLGLLVRQVDGNWAVLNAQNTQTVQLESNGFVSYGDLYNVVFTKFRRPDTVSSETFYGDSKYYGDTLLKAFDWKRYVGSEQVKIVSAGKALKDTKLVDPYGRAWQVRLWNVEYDDSVLISVALPVPDGYLSLILYTKTVSAVASQRDLEMMAAFASPTYNGTLEQWRDFLSRKELLPAALAGTRIEPDPSQALRFTSKHLALEVPSDLQKVRPDSLLALQMGYFRDGPGVVWDIAGIALRESVGSGKAMIVSRYAKPAPSLPQQFTLQWEKLQTRAFPYNAAVSEANGHSIISSPYPFPAQSPAAAKEPAVIYTMAVVAEGKQVDADMSAALTTLSRGLNLN